MYQVKLLKLNKNKNNFYQNKYFLNDYVWFVVKDIDMSV